MQALAISLGAVEYEELELLEHPVRLWWCGDTRDHMASCMPKGSRDLDGHIWEVFLIEPSAIKQ